MNKRILEINNLSVGFKTYEGDNDVLDLQKLVVEEGEAFGIVGESGSGKSVLALSILGLLQIPPARMSVQKLHFDGVDLQSLNEKEFRKIRGRKIAMIFQDPMSSLNPVFSIGVQLVEVVKRIHDESTKNAKSRVIKFIKLVGLPDPESVFNKYPHELSGGQRQRVIIALALCCDAKMIIADEPTRNLDVTIQAGILKTIVKLKQELGVSLLFLANNFGLISAICDKVGVMLDGRIVETGTVEEVLTNPVHPYTRILLKAIPSVEDRKRDEKTKLSEIEPVVLEELSIDNACPYLNRCSQRSERCSQEPAPKLAAIEGSHEVACYCISLKGSIV